MAHQEAILTGEFGSEKLPRLVERCAEGSSAEMVLSYRIAFRVDEQGRVLGQGEISVDPTVLCERCLKPLQHSLSSQTSWAFVSNDEKASVLPREYEPVVVDGEGFDLAEVLEDEALLALPMFSYHPEGECEMPVIPEQGTETAGASKSPFANLAELLKKTD